jgi:tetratricopeptide (TPR) repeat protein
MSAFRPHGIEFALAEYGGAIADYPGVESDTPSPMLRRAMPAVALLAAAFICYQAVRFWIADHRVHTERLDALESAIRLEPGNADAWDALGRFRQLDFTDADPAESLAAYKQAVERNPHSAALHMNLAGAYEAAGDIANARAQFAEASAVYPLSAEVNWNYGNFLLRQGQDEEGYTQIHKAILSDRSLLTLAASRVWRASRDVDVLLDRVLPQDAEAYTRALDYFSSIHATAPSLAVWRRLTSLGQPLELSKSFPLIEALIQDDDAADATRVWAQALTAAGMPSYEPPNHSLIWNGNFTHDFENGGLDWRYDPLVGVAFDFDSTPGGRQGRSFRMDFGGGSNFGIDQPMQYVPVEPSRAYHFRVSMRTEDITTESGLRFWITDPNHAGVTNLLTENLTGSNPWKTIAAEFTTGPETHFLAIHLRRTESRLFENRLSGTVWVADAYLIPAEFDTEPLAK